jgi:hypothetical protein
MLEDKGHSGYNEPNFGGSNSNQDQKAKPNALTTVNSKTKRYFSSICNGTQNTDCHSIHMITLMNYKISYHRYDDA